MPIPYQIDRSESIIRTRCVGKVTLEETLQHFDELERDPSCPDHLDVLLDFRQLESMPNIDELVTVADKIQRIRHRIKFGACAVVAESDVLFGIGRMFATLAGPYFELTSVFHEFLQAEFWLRSVRRRE